MSTILDQRKEAWGLPRRQGVRLSQWLWPASGDYLARSNHCSAGWFVGPEGDEIVRAVLETAVWRWFRMSSTCDGLVVDRPLEGERDGYRLEVIAELPGGVNVWRLERGDDRFGTEALEPKWQEWDEDENRTETSDAG